MSGAPPGLGIYVHWPFCAAKCPYCDFNSHVRERLEPDRWAAAYEAALDDAARLTSGRRVETVFFGGGTPSLMPPEVATRVIGRIAERWTLADDAEVTLEANPTASDAGRFAGFRAAGVNRLSIGVQALADRDLEWLGRRHDVAEALAAIEAARLTFPRLSFDLIYARPGQAAHDWAAELGRALTLAADHLSLYQLTIEPGTQFHARARRGETMAADPDTGADLFELTQALTAAAGLPAYEISNHAAAGAECRHNLIYWRQGDYLGIGPGAHGRLTKGGRRRASRAHRAPEVWLDRIEAGTGDALRWTDIAPAEWLAEVVMMGLRLPEGVALGRLAAIAGDRLSAWLPDWRIAALTEEGLLSPDVPGRLAATPEGSRRLNGLLDYLLAELPESEEMLGAIETHAD